MMQSEGQQQQQRISIRQRTTPYLATFTFGFFAMSDKPTAPPGEHGPPPPYAAGQVPSYPSGHEAQAPFGGQPAAQTFYVPPNPPAGYQPPPTTATTTTVIVTDGGFYNQHPVNTQCPNCQSHVLSETTPTSGTLTWMLCLIIAFLGGIFGCCLIPFCVDACKDVQHRCPQCKAHLGTYRRLQDTRYRYRR